MNSCYCSSLCQLLLWSSHFQGYVVFVFLVAKSCRTLLRPHGLQPTRLLLSIGFPGKNTGVVCHFLLQGIFPSQGSNWHLLHWQKDSLPLSYQGSPTSKDKPLIRLKVWTVESTIAFKRISNLRSPKNYFSNDEHSSYNMEWGRPLKAEQVFSPLVILIHKILATRHARAFLEYIYGDNEGVDFRFLGANSVIAMGPVDIGNWLMLSIFRVTLIFGLIETMLVFKVLGNRSVQETGVPIIVDICSWTKWLMAV